MSGVALPILQDSTRFVDQDRAWGVSCHVTMHIDAHRRAEARASRTNHPSRAKTGSPGRAIRSASGVFEEGQRRPAMRAWDLEQGGFLESLGPL